MAEAYQPFIAPSSTDTPATDTSGSYRIIKPDHPILPAITGKAFWSNEVWQMGHAEDGAIAIEIYDVIQARWVPVANLSNDFSYGSIQPFYGRRAAPAPHALNYPYDQAILINRLLFKEVAIIHGAGIVIDGKGYVFFGPSGIGKTTISRLWVSRNAELLNDDRVAVYKDNTGWRIAGTPWHGEEPKVSPLSAPLAGVVRLRQSPQNTLRKMPHSEGLSEILACALIPFFSHDGIGRAIDLLGAMYDTVPMLEFSFCPKPDAIDFFLSHQADS